MARRPEDRYPSMTDLAADLESWLADEPVSAYCERWPSRIARWSRRHKSWAVAIAAILLAILAILGLTAESFRRSADREREAREHGLRVAAKFAARTVAAEIDRRWRILEDESDDPNLLHLMTRAAGKPFGSPERRQLQRWLEQRFARHQPAAAAANWFLTDDRGTQIARAPLIEKGIGVNYAFRDYFHGRGRDLPEGTKDVAPTQHPHRSIVFRSRNTGTYMVVFSVPVRSLPAPVLGDANEAQAETKILGVLGMSVDVGRFGVLQHDLGTEQIAVLGDLRPDETGRRGLVLHHPGFGGPDDNQRMVYLDSVRINELESLRRAALERFRARGRPTSAQGTPAPRAATLPHCFDRDYQDPFGGQFSGRWLAAFEPVLIEGRPDLIDDTGWVVIVQERASGPGS
jgi:hypothetical protein